MRKCHGAMAVGAAIWVFPFVAGAAAPASQPIQVSPDGVWFAADEVVQAREQDQSHQTWVRPNVFKAYQLDDAALTDALGRAPMEFTPEAAAPAEITLPMPDGGFARFRFVESPVMAPELAAKFPEIKTYLGQGIDDPAATVRFDRTPAGLHAQVLSPNGTIYVDPYFKNDATLHASYYRRDYPRSAEGWQCLTESDPLETDIHAFDDGDLFRVVGENLRTYRLACAANGEFTAFHGGTVPAGLAGVTTLINRVTGLYEIDVALRVQLVANNNLIIYTNSATDPYSNTEPGLMLSQNQTTCDAVIGNANYDVGHVVSTGGGGVAILSVVCISGSKARGVSGISQPAGDPFSVDYVVHEMGHQFSATHSFNGTGGFCAGGNRTAATAYEPGSGSTIMAYAGICSADDLQNHSDPYLHSVSQTQIINFTTAAGHTCDVVTATGNLPPTVGAGADYTLPQSTPFKLTATGSDPNGERVTFCWEQRDLGPAAPLTMADQGSIPLWRSWDPTLDPTRTFPRLSNLLANNFAPGERHATTNRTLHFRCTARDNRGGTAFDDMQAVVNAASGPFIVTSPDTAVTWSVSPQTVTWNVANTAAAPVNTPNVNILLSLDGGQTFPITLAAGTPNDGGESVNVPALASSTARIKVEGAGNIFFDISNANFTLAMPVQFGLTGSNPIDDSVPNGNNNGALDPGESNVNVNIGVRNDGPSAATGVSATLTSLSPTVSVVSGASAYPDMGAGGGSGFNLAPFTLAVSPSHVCGTPANLRLSLVSDQGAADLNVALATGEGSPMTFSYNAISGPDPVVALPDGGAPVNIALNVSGVGPIADVNFSFDGTVCNAVQTSTTVGLNHARVGDITSTLISPSGTAVPLTVRPGGGGLGSTGNNFCQTVLDDDGAFPAIQTIPVAGAPYTGTWKPAWPLSYFDGENADGLWTLRIVDTAFSNTGSLRAFSLTFIPRVCAPPFVPVVACCYPDGTCANVITDDCTHGGGESQGLGSVCLGDANSDGTDDLCDEPGACCLGGGNCISATRSDCEAQTGQFQGEGISCEPNPCGCPDLIGAASRKCSPSCDLAFESRQGGISQVVFNYSAPPPGVPAPTVESDCTCPSPPLFGAMGAIPTCAASGNDLVCTFSPSLPSPCTYRFLACSGTGTMSVVIRSLVGDVNGNGSADAVDRSGVVSVWTGAGYSCATDLDCDGGTNSVDRSLVISSWTSGQNCTP